MTEVKKHREWTLCSNYSTDHDAMKWFVSRDSEVTPEVETPERLRVIEISAVKELEAEAMRIKSQALAQNKGLVQFELAQKWDGKLPTMMMGNTVPLLDLKGFNQ